MSIKYSSNEEYLLGSLLYDLNDSNLFLLNQDNNKTLKSSKIFIDFVDLNKSSNSNGSSKDSSFVFLSKEEILISLQNQKTALNLQSQIKHMCQIEINHIFFELKGLFNEIIKDKNGNYFCSDLFKKLNEKQRYYILKEISNEFLLLAILNYSTHPIQTLIQLSNSDDEINFYDNIFKDENTMKFFVMNPNGCFVIKKFILYLPENKRTKINYYFLKLLCSLSMNMYGVSLVKKFISTSKNQQIINQIFQIIIHNFLKICQNQYGNYLIQFLLEFYEGTKKLDIIKNLIYLNFNELANNIYSFHICESYINILSIKEKKNLLKNLLNNKKNNQIKLNKYGMYIIIKLKKNNFN